MQRKLAIFLNLLVCLLAWKTVVHHRAFLRKFGAGLDMASHRTSPTPTPSVQSFKRTATKLQKKSSKTTKRGLPSKKKSGPLPKAVEKVDIQLRTSLAPVSKTDKLSLSLASCFAKLDLAVTGNKEATRWLLTASNSRSNRVLAMQAKACVMYLYEVGTTSMKKDHQQAAKLGAKTFAFLKQAVESVSPEHTHHLTWLLSLCYKHELGSKSQLEEALRLLRIAAEGGSKYAQNGLGYAYYHNQSYQQAAQWYSKAATQGLATAQCNLGSCYYQGLGLPRSLDWALYWWLKAADQGAASAQFNLAVYCSTTPPGEHGGNLAALDWLTKAAQQNHAVAMLKLATDFCSDETEAAGWLQTAAALDYAPAQNKLATAYLLGQGVPQSCEHAAEWFARAARQGLAVAQRNLGCLYEQGHGVTQDIRRAMELYAQAADQGCAEALYSMGELYMRDQGVSQDVTKGMDWLARAAEGGCVDAQYKLALSYDRGDGVERSALLAKKWFLRAARQGHENAASFLARL